MNLRGMSQTRLRAWLVLIIWVVAGAVFAFAFFSGGGVAGFDTDPGRHVVAAAAIGFGFLAYGVALLFTRRRDGRVAMDERDLQVMARASQGSFIVVIVAVFALCLTLWTLHEGDGMVEVGWMWFVPYGSAVLAFITNAVAVLILDGRTGGNV